MTVSRNNNVIKSNTKRLQDYWIASRHSSLCDRSHVYLTRRPTRQGGRDLSAWDGIEGVVMRERTGIKG